MTKNFGWLGLLALLALVPSACDGDDDTTGTGGTGGGPSAGKGGSSAGKGGASGKSGNGGTSNSGGKAGKAGRGGTGGSGNASGTDGAGFGGDDTSVGGAPASGGTSAAGAGGESAASGQPGAAGQAGNGGEGGEAPVGPIEIAGTWENTDFGQTDVIDAESWSQDYGTGPTVSAIVKFSNSANFAIRQAPHDALYDPDKFDRTVWTDVDGGVFYYCTIDHGLDTAEEAEARTTAFDANDVDGIGCDGFPWTKMTAP